MTTYSKRESFFEKTERSWTVTGEGLDIVMQGQVFHVRWSAITGLRLAFAPTEPKPWRYVCQVSVRGGPRFEIDNGHFAGIGNFDDRSADYREMVEALVEGLAAARPGFRVHIGASPASYYGQILFVGTMFAFLAGVLILTDGGGTWSWTSMVKMGIIAVSLPLLAVWLVRARPRTAPIHTLPAGCLPR